MKLFFVLSLIFTFHITLKAQNNFDVKLSAQFNYAKEQFEKEEYFDAITEFKRLIFFDACKKFSYSANLFIAKSYSHGGFYKLAEEYFMRAARFSRSPRELYEVKLEALKMYLVSRDESRALNLISEITSRKDFLDFKNESIYWSGMVHLFFNHAEAAKMFFNQITTNEFELFNYVQFLNEICDSISANQKSVGTAKLLSYILPGAGQIYLGHYFRGISSFTWNALSIYLAADAFSSKRDFDGVMIMSLIWYRFYSGNIENTDKFAENFNSKVLNNWLNYLQFEYKGPKP